ncbi:hypothetical protein DOK67_0000734 [Enterococcus sp. DIV0212c]|uniref:hypothetical protein n=1 Tax=Enterococcus sp. DIV0212c TaxID=2230867 RepID=UPI001A9A7CFA|nr:hypothetical protein [Enterococcus sp. DIV0212c]MBO1353158.1 hypothetical protein [Enterococcus sp. DIV0212c]
MFRKSVTYLGLVSIIGGILCGNMSTTLAVENKKKIPVTYNNINDITDPENPKEPEYIITVPASIIFTDKRKEIDTTVLMTNLDGTKYDGEKSSTVEVFSKNEFKLVNGKAQVAYKLVTIDDQGKEKLVTNNNNQIGIFNKKRDSVKGLARLVEMPNRRGWHSDVLTYRVISDGTSQ